MRLFAAAVVGVLASACVHAPRTTPSQSSPAGRINPVDIKRVARELPAGYEVTSVSPQGGPAATWGLAAGATADPPRCAELAAPDPGQSAIAQGISGSGPGGVVYAVVMAAHAAPEPRLVAACPQWTMTDGRARARVRLTAPPRIDGVPTLGMTADTIAPAEGGNEIISRATTFIAYLDSYDAFSTLVSDPGSVRPALAPQFAGDLLVKSVSALSSRP